MVCDKCKKKFADDSWIPGDGWPRYEITEKVAAIGGVSDINLCQHCSRELSFWLNTEEAEERRNDHQN